MTDAWHETKQLKLEDVEANFEQVLDDVLVSGGPIKIVKDTGNAILVSEEVWRGLTETLSLMAIPGMRDSIRSGMRQPIADTATGLDW
jgi:PHD/YefM family antitoxin component YafN of YafNO toxin-antitoxin module